MLDDSALGELLFKHFGFRHFLEGQQPVVQAVLGGRDVLVVMPTGGGKSLCYQFPAMALDGITIVVSPLIALMKDQVDGLRAKNVPATYINSSLSQSEVEQRISAMMRGEYRLVYIAPERFKNDRFVTALAPLSIGLFAVDEAHCISQWGHDFRPDYTRLKQVLDELGRPQVAALTATATAEVREDIVAQLGLGAQGRTPPEIFISGFARHNLMLRVREIHSRTEKLDRILSTVKRLKTGIVYCATRKNVALVSEALAHGGAKCIAYTGGMGDRERSLAQEKFMTGQSPVAVATNAFGMGVDRSDVRFVIHYDIPGSIEAYYQEAGRAGRDGEPSECELLFTFADVRVQEFFIEGGNPTREIIAGTRDALAELCADGPVAMTQKQVAEHVCSADNDMSVGSAIGLLERHGFIQRYSTGGYTKGERDTARFTTALVQPVKDLKDLGIDFARLKQKRERDEAKLRRMIDYAYFRGCRHGYILKYFGDPQASDRCIACDNCAAPKGGGAGQRADPGFRSRGAERKNRRGTVAPAGAQRGEEVEAEFWANLSAPPAQSADAGGRQDAGADRTAGVSPVLGAHNRRDAGGTVFQPPATSTGTEAGPAYASADSAEKTILLQKALSCVVRMRGRFGLGRVALVLTGSHSRQIFDFQLEKLSTYGLLKDFGYDFTLELLRRLVAAGCIETRLVDELPRASITELGKLVMQAKAAVDIELPDYGLLKPAAKQPAAVAAVVPEPPYDTRVFEALRRWRAQTASGMNVPAYVVYADATLKDLARKKPRTESELLQVKGVGQGKVKQFGAETLRIISEQES